MRGSGYHAEVLVGPGCHHAQPATALFVVFAFTVPVKLHFDTAIFVGMDFFAGRANYGGGIDAGHLGIVRY